MSARRAFATGPAARSFGRMLRRRRQELDLTLERLAELVPCSVQHLSEIERGERYASLPALCRVEWALSGSGMLTGWVLPLVLEQLRLHHPVYATSRGWESEPATNTRGERLDPSGIGARVDDLIERVHREEELAFGGIPQAAAPTREPALAPRGTEEHHGGHEPAGTALAQDVVPGPGRPDACPPLRMWLDGRPCTVRIVAADVEVDDHEVGRPPRDRVNRRRFLRVGSVGGVGALGVAGSTAGLLSLSTVDPRVLDYLEGEAERLPRDFWAGPEEVHFPRADDAYKLANAFLAELPRLRDQVRLHRVTARLAVLRGEGEVFGLRLDAAEGWYRHAADRATEVGDTGLALWSFARLAMMRSWTGAAPQAVIDVAAEAHHIGGATPGAAAAMIAAAEARAHARLGHRAEFMAKLRVAEGECDRASPGERVPSIFGVTDARRMLDTAAAWVLIGEPREAEREARQAISLYDPWHRTDLAVVRLHLASALADQGRADEACASAREALPARPAGPAGLSGLIAHAATELDHHLQPYRDMPAVQEVRALITSTG
jgi:Helix-turn-helix domain